MDVRVIVASNLTQACRLLGISKPSIYARIRRYEIDVPRCSAVQAAAG
ncbi:MAG: hypothetical protein R3E94_16825 [Burkholderiaceae bacterium]